ncbi:MAG: hypothetical protein ACHQ6U_10130 [Thermodesulfobacteriota bacterium]
MIRLVLLMLTVILILPVVGCDTIKTGKDIATDAVGNPITETKKKHSLYDTRQEVEKTRYQLDQCVKANSGDQTKCESQKAAYDKSVQDYVSLQTE